MPVKFDPTLLKALRKDLEPHLQEVAKKYGISLVLGKITYQDTEFTAKVTGHSEAGKSSTDLMFEKQERAFRDYANYGLLGVGPAENERKLKVSDLGREIHLGGRIFILRGYNPRSTKAPFAATDLHPNKPGTYFKLTDSQVARGLEQAEKVKEASNGTH